MQRRYYERRCHYLSSSVASNLPLDIRHITYQINFWTEVIYIYLRLQTLVRQIIVQLLGR